MVALIHPYLTPNPPPTQEEMSNSHPLAGRLFCPTYNCGEMGLFAFRETVCRCGQTKATVTQDSDKNVRVHCSGPGCVRLLPDWAQRRTY